MHARIFQSTQTLAASCRSLALHSPSPSVSIVLVVLRAATELTCIIPRISSRITGDFSPCSARPKASLLSFVEKLATDSNYTHQCSVVCEAPMTTSGLPEAVARQACEAARSRKKLELMQLVLPIMRGCQAKMLHGYPCFHPMATPELEAMQRLTAARVPGAFAFVGLTERWVQSICLFHFLLEQGRPPVPREFKNTRPTRTSDARQRRILSRADEWSVIAADNSDVRGWLLQDRWDGLLFNLATRSFNRRLTAALNQSQWVETCMRRHSLGDQVIREDPAEAGVAPKDRQMFSSVRPGVPLTRIVNGGFS